MVYLPEMTSYAAPHPRAQMRMILAALDGLRVSVSERIDPRTGIVRTVSPKFGGKQTAKLSPDERSIIRERLTAASIIFEETEKGFTRVRVKSTELATPADAQAFWAAWNKEETAR